VGTTSNFFLGFVYGILAARILGAKGYGQLILVITAVRLLTTPFHLQFEVPLVDFARKEGGESPVRGVDRVAGSFLLQGGALLLFGLVFALGLVTVPPRWELFADWQVALGYFALSEVIFRLRQLAQSVWQAFEYFTVHSTFNVLSALARNLGVVPFMWYGVQEVCLGYFLVELVLGGGLAGWVLWLYVKRALPVPTFRYSTLRRVAEEFYYHARSNYLARLLKGVQNRVEPVILGQLMGPTEVAWVNVGRKFNPVIRLFVNPVQTYLYPRLIGKWKRDREAFFDTFRRYLYLSTPFFLLLAAGICTLAPWLIPALYGPEFIPSVLVLWIVLPPLALEGPLRLFPSLTFVIRQARAIFNLYLLRFVVGLPGYFLLTYRFGYVGAAAALGLVSLLVLAYKVWFLRRKLGTRWMYPAGGSPGESD